jgi:uncharacterized protein YukE
MLDSGNGGDRQLQVHPPTVDSLGAKFQAESQALAKALATFNTDAFTVAQAFGLLGACDGAMQQYQKLLASTTKGLGQLEQLLDNTGQRLSAASGNYAAAEQAAHQRMRFVGHED